MDWQPPRYNENQIEAHVMVLIGNIAGEPLIRGPADALAKFRGNRGFAFGLSSTSFHFDKSDAAGFERDQIYFAR